MHTHTHTHARTHTHRRKQLGLSSEVALLPEEEEDAHGATLAFYAHGGSEAVAKKQVRVVCL